MITKETIDRIFETARVEEVVGDFVTLKKAGSGLKGLSPFTNEKTPSFNVSPAKQIWKDFSSGKGGNVVTFLMEYEGFTYPEALRYLAQRYNIEIEETAQSDEQKKERNQRESLFLVNEFAIEYFEKQLWHSDEGRQIGLSYFKERGFSEESIRHFRLGYSSEDWEGFTNAALQAGYQLAYLEQTGLTKVDGEKRRDRFRGRVMFPIMSHTGRVLGFGGRILKKNVKAPKYLNSTESDIYHKSHTLYGIHQARQALGREDEAFLVEGYTDVISLHQAGVKNVVASSGTSLTEGQIALLKRYTQNITVLFDGDAAGMRASLRGIDLILKQGVQVRVVPFPEGEDPDSFARRNSPAALREYLKEERADFLRFKARLLLADSGDSALEKSKAAREMLKSIALIPQVLEREAYVRETARLMEIDEKSLFRELAQIEVKAGEQQYREEQRQKEREQNQQPAMQVISPGQDIGLEPLHLQEEALCWLLLNHGQEEMAYPVEEPVTPAPDGTPQEPLLVPVATYLITELQQDELSLSHPQYRLIWEHFAGELSQNERVAEASELLRASDPELVATASHLVSQPYHLHNWRSRNIYIPPDNAFVPAFAREAMLRFKEKKVAQIIQVEQQKLAKAEGDSQTIMETIWRLVQLKNKIDQALNRVV